jgi:hypothetical protein
MGLNTIQIIPENLSLIIDEDELSKEVLKTISDAINSAQNPTIEKPLTVKEQL